MFHLEPLPLPNYMPELDAIFGEFESGLPEIDLDDSEDFLLTNAQQNEQFGLAISNADVDRAIAARVPEKICRQLSWAVSTFSSDVLE